MNRGNPLRRLGVSKRDAHLPAPPDDPRPTPPERPSQDDCCHSGCSPCIFDLYDEALDRYEAALAAWEARQAERRL